MIPWTGYRLIVMSLRTQDNTTQKTQTSTPRTAQDLSSLAYTCNTAEILMELFANLSV